MLTLKLGTEVQTIKQNDGLSLRLQGLKITLRSKRKWKWAVKKIRICNDIMTEKGQEQQ